MKKKREVFFFILVFIFTIYPDTVLVDNNFKYKLYLPNNWIREIKNDSVHFFVDTSFCFKGLLCITRYLIDTSIYKTPTEWTLSHFLAYKIWVQYSLDPAGVILYSNNDSTVKQGDLPAAEAYSIFFSSDTAIGIWAEYIRYTAYDKFGYELYAISDTQDMSKNIGTYAAILQGINIVLPLKVKKNSFCRINFNKSKNILLCDLLGRTIFFKGQHFRRKQSGIYIKYQKENLNNRNKDLELIK